MKHKSRWHHYQHLVRLARRQALAGDPVSYALYMQLCDNEHKFLPARNICPLARQLSKVQGYKIMRDMGWRSA